MKINSIYFNEYHHLLKILQLSNTVIQQNYMLLRANELIDCTMQVSYEQLKKLNQGQRDVKFMTSCADDGGAMAATNENAASTPYTLANFNITITENGLNSELAILGEEDLETVNEVPAKRIRLDLGELSKRPNKKLFPNELTRNIKSTRTVPTKASVSSNLMGPPRVPKLATTTTTTKSSTSSTVVNFDETHVISTQDLDLLDIETEMKSPLPKLTGNLNSKNGQIRSKPNLIKNILAENNTLFTNKGSRIYLIWGIPKLINFYLILVGKVCGKVQVRPVTLGLNKENRKISPRIRKSPTVRTPRNNIASKSKLIYY